MGDHFRGFVKCSIVFKIFIFLPKTHQLISTRNELPHLCELPNQLQAEMKFSMFFVEKLTNKTLSSLLENVKKAHTGLSWWRVSSHWKNNISFTFQLSILCLLTIFEDEKKFGIRRRCHYQTKYNMKCFVLARKLIDNYPWRNLWSTEPDSNKLNFPHTWKLLINYFDSLVLMLLQCSTLHIVDILFIVTMTSNRFVISHFSVNSWIGEIEKALYNIFSRWKMRRQVN